MKLNLAKLLFPRMPEDQRHHQLRLILASFTVALVVSGIVVLIMLLTDQMTESWIAQL
jgi:hypothetical protein